MDEYSKQQLLKAWQLRVEGIDFFKIPSGERFAKYNTDGIVNRITGTTKGYIASLWAGKATGISELDDKTFIDVYLKGKVKNKDTWFEDAINTAQDEEPNPELFFTLNFDQDADRLLEDIELVKTMLFPAYRAFKESYERHIESNQNANSERYNAEKDAYLAIKGVMMTLLDWGSEEFDDEYESYCDEIESLLTPEEIKEQVNQLRTEENAAIDDDIDNEGQEKDADEDEPEYEVEDEEPAEEEEKQQESADKEQLSNVNFNPAAHRNFTDEEFEIFNLNAEASQGGALANRQLMAWQLRVAGIDFYEAPTGQQYKFLEKKSGIYERLTGTVKGYLLSVMHGALTGIKEIDERPGMIYATGEFDKKKWFDNAIKVGKGQNPRPDLLQTLDQGETLEQSISLTKEQLLPAYRALKESFERRSFIQWIFNHDQYTAERDSYRAIRGVMMTLLDQTREEFDDTYEQYCKDVKSLLTPKEIKEETKESRRIAKLKAAEKKENVKEIKKNLEQDKSDLQANNNLKDEDTNHEQENEKENVYFGNLFEEKNEVTSEVIHEDKVKDKSKNI